MVDVMASSHISWLLAALLLSNQAANAQETTGGPLTSFAALGDTFEAVQDAAVARFEELAAADDAMASLALARRLMASTSIEEQREGVALAEQAAEAGALEATLLLGDIYRRGGSGVAPDLEKARGYLETALENGSTDAAVSLGQLYLATDFTAEGSARGVDLIEGAAEDGSIDAANVLAGLYVNGRGVDANLDRAFDYFSVGLVSNQTPTIVAFGDVLRAGSRGNAPDFDLAMDFFEQASEAGEISADRRIADMHLRGQAVPQDIPGAIAMLDTLATAGDTNSDIALGDIFARGEYVPIDSTRALEHYQVAADNGNLQGNLRLAEVYATGMPGLPPNFGQSLALYNEASELGSPGAKRALAQAFLGGRFGTIDPSRAVGYLEEAATLGDGQAAEDLAVLYATNEPFPANYEEVQRYLNLALALGNVDAAVNVSAAVVTGPLARAHRDDARAMIEGAIESGVPGASATLARLQLDGAFPAEGVGGVISMLTAAAESGDIEAARFMISLYRDGYGLLLPANIPAANDFLTSVETQLGPELATAEHIHLDALQSEGTDTLERISERFATLSQATAMDVLDILRRENARAYVYLLQEGLAERGKYSGPISGSLDSPTIRAINATCAELGAQAACAPGPLTRGAVLTIGNYILQPPALVAQGEAVDAVSQN
jgi:TPR repeat protein